MLVLHPQDVMGIREGSKYEGLCSFCTNRMAWACSDPFLVSLIPEFKTASYVLFGQARGCWVGRPGSWICIPWL